MALNPLPLPLDSPVVAKDGTMTWIWIQTLTARDQQLAVTPERVVDVSVSAQTASIGATALGVGTSAAVYRLTLLARITQAATVSSSLTVAVQWTVGGVACTKTYTALTGNTTSTYLAETFPARIDANTSLTYSTTYASVGATVMQYGLEVIAERVI